MIGSRFWTALLLSFFAGAALAQPPTPYPSKPIKWVVP